LGVSRYLIIPYMYVMIFENMCMGLFDMYKETNHLIG
jgi:hypothetical protein